MHQAAFRAGELEHAGAALEDSRDPCVLGLGAILVPLAVLRYSPFRIAVIPRLRAAPASLRAERICEPFSMVFCVDFETVQKDPFLDGSVLSWASYGPCIKGSNAATRLEKDGNARFA